MNSAIDFWQNLWHNLLGVMILVNYKKLYFHLFGTLATAVEHLENGNIGLAKDLLLRAQCEAEEIVIEQDEETENTPQAVAL